MGKEHGCGLLGRISWRSFDGDDDAFGLRCNEFLWWSYSGAFIGRSIGNVFVAYLDIVYCFFSFPLLAEIGQYA